MRVEPKLVVQEDAECEDDADGRDIVESGYDDANGEKRPAKDERMKDGDATRRDGPPRFVSRILVDG